MKAFHASARDKNRNIGITRDTARTAALAFFAAFPGKRKCNVSEGTSDGQFFTLTLYLRAGAPTPRSWKDVTPKTAKDLPDLESLVRAEEQQKQEASTVQ